MANISWYSKLFQGGVHFGQVDEEDEEGEMVHNTGGSFHVAPDEDEVVSDEPAELLFGFRHG